MGAYRASGGHGGARKLQFIGLLSITVVAVAFGIVFFGFSSMRRLVETAVVERTQAVALNSLIGRSLVSLNADRLALRTAFVRNPPLLAEERQYMLSSLADLKSLCLTGPNVFAGEEGQELLGRYGAGLGRVVDGYADINDHLSEIDGVSDSIGKDIDALEEHIGELMVDLTLAGEDTSRLAQFYTLLPPCRERLLRVRLLTERKVALSHQHLFDKMPAPAGLAAMEVIEELSRTVETLTAAPPDVAEHARGIVAKTVLFGESMAGLDRAYQRLQEAERELAAVGEEVWRSLEILDQEAAEAMGAVQDRMKGVARHVSFALTAVSLFALAFTAAGWYLVRDIGRGMEGAMNEAVTAREALETSKETLERQNVELRKLDRMKDAWIRDVTHELKTPVAKHAMQLEILRPILSTHALPEEGERAILVMEKSVKRQESVIRNLLDLSRLQAGGRSFRAEPVRLDELLRSVVDDYRYAIEKSYLDVTLDLPATTVNSDGDMLWHLFSNLLNNAIKFRKKEGRGRVVVAVEPGETEILVRIRDDGIGMGEEEKSKVFSTFYQATPSSEGSGVGLSICRRITEGLGGRIWIDSEGKGKGATATVALPVKSPRGSPEKGEESET